MRELQLILIATAISVIVGGGLYFFLQGGVPGASQYSPAFRTIDVSLSGPTNVLVDRKNYVFRSEGDFIAFWELLHGNEIRAPRPPQVAFDREQVIAVVGGIKPTGGYSIVVTDVVDTPGERIVYIESTAPSAGCSVTQSETNPYHIIAVKRTEKVLRAEEVKLEDC